MPASTGHPAPQTAAVVLATTASARLACADGTVLDRLAEQLDTLPLRDVHVVARTAVPVGPGPAEGTRGLADDLRCVAKVARAAGGPVAVIPGDLVAHTEALASVLAHPARGTSALVSDVGEPAGPLHPPVRAEGGMIASAGSSFHDVAEPTGTFRGVLQVGEADLGTLADLAEELADLVQTGRLGAAAGTEVADLILVGLVRVGVPVRAIPLGPLRADRVAGQAAADAAVRGLAEVDEKAVRLDSSVKRDDGFFTTHFVSSWSTHLVRLAARLSLTPNSVTGISVGLALLAAVWFSAGTRGAMLLGAALVLLSFVLDCVDGQLARYTRAFSPLGAWLDGTADRAKEYVVYVGLAAGYTAITPASGDIWALAVAAMVLQSLRHSIDFSYGAARSDAHRVSVAHARRPRSLTSPADPPQMVPAQRLSTEAPVLRLSRRLEDDRRTRWLKKIIVLPIGERMALIAVTAGLFDARVTFLALLGWGGVAALYTLIGRIARSLS
ncbi:CDP-alcohol phosphatidyltransferase family protein [Streptosporangium soli]